MKMTILGIGFMTILMFLLVPVAQAQLSFNNLDPIEIDFYDFNGSGFQPNGTEGALDSNIWKTLGLSDGSMDFSDSKMSGDFARGLNDGGTNTGGFYAWGIAFEDDTVIAAGWQPGGADASPGNLVLWLRNNTGCDVSGFYISFDRWVNNDQDRSSSLDFGYQTTNPTDTMITGTVVDTFTTSEISDALGFQMTSSGVIAVPYIVPNSGDIYFIWSTDDVAGSGSRDEFGISNISITPYVGEPSAPTPEWSTILLMGLGLLWLGGFIWFKRRQKIVVKT